MFAVNLSTQLGERLREALTQSARSGRSERKFKMQGGRAERPEGRQYVRFSAAVPRGRAYPDFCGR